MLRILVIALLGINLALFGWRMLTPAPEPSEEIDRKAVRNVARDPLPSISLLSEQPSSEPRVGVVQRAPRECFSLGPFMTRVDLRVVASRIRADVLSISTRQVEAEVNTGYWVYLPPEADLQRLAVDDAVLSAGGVEDYAVIQRGPEANMISLGLYGRLEDAQQRKSGLEKMGLPFVFEIGPRIVQETHYWMDYEIDTGQGTDVGELTADEKAAQAGDLERLALPCSSLEQALDNRAEPVLALPLEELGIQDTLDDES